MGDHQRGAAAHQLGQRRLHQLLGLGVEGTGGLVQQQDRRVAQDRACDRDALALPAGQPRAALTEESVVPGRQLAQKLIGRSRSCRRFYLSIVSPGTPVADILARAGAEQHRVLRYEGDLPAQFFRIQTLDIVTIDRDPATLRIVKAQQQLKAGALAGAGRAHHGDRLATAHRQRVVVERQSVGPRRISKADVLEGDIPAHPCRERQRLGWSRDRRPRLQQLGQPLHGPGGALHLAPHLGQCGRRGAHDRCIDEELAQLPPGHVVRQYRVGAQPQHIGDATEYQHGTDAGQCRAHARAADGGDKAVLHCRGIALALQFLERERLYRLYGVERFIDQAAGVGDPVLGSARQASHPAAHHDHRHDHYRHQCQDPDGEPGAGERQQHHRPDQV